MLRLLTLTTVAIAGLALAASAALAKGPFEAELSGGDLAAPVPIGAIEHDWIDSYERDAPLTQPNHTYTLRLWERPDGGDRIEWATFTYYPAQEGDTAAIQYPDGHFGTINGAFARVLDSAIAQQSPAVTDEGGTTLAWWFIPSAVGLGIVLLGGGLAGSRLLRRRQPAPA